MNLAAVIMAGGTGSRFWPVSRQDHPKQLVSLDDKPSMLRSTISRLRRVVDPERIFVVTARAHAEAVEEQCSELPGENLFAEPEGRDTAAAAGFATYWVRKRLGEDAIMGLFPADHRIRPEAEFADEVIRAANAARELDGLVTFGIKPTFPSTGYGYIQYKPRPHTIDEAPVHRVEQFHEKPDVDRAREYLQQGSFFWNSGMFVWPVQRFVRELETYMPELKRRLDGMLNEWTETGDLSRAAASRYPGLPKTSVDYGVMERSETVWTVPAGFDWNDVGSWDALREVFETDEQGNVSLGDVVNLDSTNSVLVARDGLTVATVGADELVVVATDDAVLVCDINQTQDVKTLVRSLKEQERTDLL